MAGGDGLGCKCEPSRTGLGAGLRASLAERSSRGRINLDSKVLVKTGVKP